MCKKNEDTWPLSQNAKWTVFPKYYNLRETYLPQQVILGNALNSTVREFKVSSLGVKHFSLTLALRCKKHKIMAMYLIFNSSVFLSVFHLCVSKKRNQDLPVLYSLGKDRKCSFPVLWSRKGEGSPALWLTHYLRGFATLLRYPVVADFICRVLSTSECRGVLIR